MCVYCYHDYRFGLQFGLIIQQPRDYGVDSRVLLKTMSEFWCSGDFCLTIVLLMSGSGLGLRSRLSVSVKLRDMIRDWV